MNPVGGTERVGPVQASMTALLGWLSAVVGSSLPVQASAPVDGGRDQLCVWPLALLAEQGVRGGGGREPMRLRVRYLVCATGPVERSIAVLDQILGAAAVDDRYHLVFEPPAASAWQALGAAPRAALLFDAAVRVDREQSSAPRVRGELRLDAVQLRTIEGRVVGPGNVPLAAIRVALGGTDIATHTDARGEFALLGVPSEASALLQLSGRGMHMQAHLQPVPAEPVVIHCDIEEV